MVQGILDEVDSSLDPEGFSVHWGIRDVLVRSESSATTVFAVRCLCADVIGTW